MPNQYKSFYRADIINKIREVALDTMCIPETDENEDANRINASVAYYNYGVKDLADTLVRNFQTLDDDE